MSKTLKQRLSILAEGNPESQTETTPNRKRAPFNDFQDLSDYVLKSAARSRLATNNSNESSPIRYPKQLPQILKGEKIFLDLEVLNEKTTSPFQQIAQAMGAVIFKRLTINATCMVTNKETSKYITKARELSVPIVNVLWITQSHDSARKMPYDKYLLRSSVEEIVRLRQSTKFGHTWIQRSRSHLKKTKVNIETDPKYSRFLKFLKKRAQVILQENSKYCCEFSVVNVPLSNTLNEYQSNL